jgi:hypothetical protein
LAYSEAEGKAFLSCTAAADETWGHHFEPQTKTQSMEWNHSQSPFKKIKKYSSRQIRIRGAQIPGFKLLWQLSFVL